MELCLDPLVPITANVQLHPLALHFVPGRPHALRTCHLEDGQVSDVQVIVDPGSIDILLAEACPDSGATVIACPSRAGLVAFVMAEIEKVDIETCKISYLIKLADNAFLTYDKQEFRKTVCDVVKLKVVALESDEARARADASEASKKERQTEWADNYERNRRKG